MHSKCQGLVLGEPKVHLVTPGNFTEPAKTSLNYWQQWTHQSTDENHGERYYDYSRQVKIALSLTKLIWRETVRHTKFNFSWHLGIFILLATQIPRRQEPFAVVASLPGLTMHLSPVPHLSSFHPNVPFVGLNSQSSLLGDNHLLLKIVIHSKVITDALIE